MTKKLLIDASHAEETRVVVLDGNRLEDFDVETATRKQIKGNIYLAKVIRVEPSLQAAFVEYGGNRHGFLAFGEIHPDYYQIPVADRQRLLAMAAEAAEEEADAEDGPLLEGESPEAASDAVSAEAGFAASPEAEFAGEPSEFAPDGEPQSERRGEAQALEITSIDIISAPPPDADSDTDADADADTDAGDGALVATGSITFGSAEPSDSGIGEAFSDAASENFAAEFSPAEVGVSYETAEPDVETSGEVLPPAEDDAEAGAEDTLAQPAPESLGGDGDDAAEARERRQRQRFLRNYKIQEVIHRRQIMLIQVVKEERGNKGAALTTYLSLAGRFSVLMPNSPTGGGVSRKITSVADRRRLKEAVSELEVPQGMGLIVRTAGANRPKPEIKRDCEYLLRLWDDIRERTMQSIAPALIYEEASLIKRTIRDVYTRDIDDVYVDGEEGYRAARDFMRMLMPSHTKKVQLWSEGQPLFAKYQVEAQLDAMLNPIVQLRSGGYIVINQTEALVAIDVNSGRSTRERSIEDTALRTNMEAAEEAARQLRMRDLAGLIVIDFIDMESRKNNASVERKLKDSLKNDRARIQVGSISHFGLMEMSRQRLRPSLAEASLIACPHCAGMGHVRSPESAALHILRAIEDEGAKYRAAEIVVTLPPDVALYLFNHKRDRLTDIETRYAMRVIFTGDASLTAANFRIEKTKAQSAPPPVPAPAPQVSHSRTPERHAEPVAAEPEDDDDVTETADAAPVAGGQANETAEEGERRRRRRRRRRGRRVEPDAASPGESDDAEQSGEGSEAIQAEFAPPAAQSIFVPSADDAPTEIDLILAAELGNPVDLGDGEPVLPVQAEPDAADGEEKPVRRRRTRGGRRRSGAAGAPEGEDASETPPVQQEIVYADVADIFEAAERAEEALRVKARLIVTPESEPELASPVHLPETAPVAVSHVVFEPAFAEPLPEPEPEPDPEPVAEVPEQMPEPVLEFASADAGAGEAEPEAGPEAGPVAGPAASEPLVKPTLIGDDPAPVDKKRGWWRR